MATKPSPQNLIKRNSVTQEMVRDRLIYDPETGDFRWRRNINSRARAGSAAGCRSHDGYRLIAIDSTLYMAHRLAWLYMTGSWPVDLIDHADGDKWNNRWSNLREADAVQNSANVKLSVRNTTGYKGVYKQKTGWQVQLGYRGRTVNGGSHKTKEEAYEAYCKLKRSLHGDFAKVD